MTALYEKNVILNMKDWKGIGEHWCDILSPDSAVPIAIYGSEYYKGKAAIVKNKYKNGWVYYIGTDPEEKTMEYLMEKNINRCRNVPGKNWER